jgi:nicotinamide mononucleotide transporter
MIHVLQQLKHLAFVAEWTAVVFSLLYVFLAAKQNRWCWVFGGLSSLISILIFIMVRLYVESLLYGFYVLMAGYGWIAWTQTSLSEKPIREISFALHVVTIAVGLFGAAVLYYVFANYTQAARPMLDSLTTSFSIITTFMVVKKILSNWLYWVVINALSVYLYWSRGLDVYAVLMALYTALAVYGFVQWNREYRQKFAHP